MRSIDMKKGIRPRLTNWIRSQNTGWIHVLRIFRIKARDWLLWKCSKRTNLVAATAFGGKMYGDNPRYIVEKIHELSPETKIVWLSSTDLHAHLPAYVQSVSFDRGNKYLRIIARASVVIGNSKCFDPQANRKDQLFIETWHGGLGFKRIGFDSASNQGYKTKKTKSGIDFYLSNSDHLTKIYRTAHHYDGPVWKCGYPIEDALLTEGNEKQLCHARFTLPKDTRILLYAPTFRSQYPWLCKLNVAQVVKAFEKRFGGHWVMLVHWHPNTKKEDRILSGAIDASDIQNLQSLLIAADAFISDYSSTIFQAVQRSVPCFVYADDFDKYSLDRGLYYALDEQPFPYALNENDLIDNIVNYHGEIWEEKWKLYAAQMGHIVTGHSAEDVAKVCVDFLNGKPKTDIMKEIPFETRF